MLSYSEPQEHRQEELKISYSSTNPEVDQGPSEHSLSRPKGKRPEQEQTGLHRKWSLSRWTVHLMKRDNCRASRNSKLGKGLCCRHVLWNWETASKVTTLALEGQGALSSQQEVNERAHSGRTRAWEIIDSPTNCIKGTAARVRHSNQPNYGEKSSGKSSDCSAESQTDPRFDQRPWWEE